MSKAMFLTAGLTLAEGKNFLFNNKKTLQKTAQELQQEKDIKAKMAELQMQLKSIQTPKPVQQTTSVSNTKTTANDKSMRLWQNVKDTVKEVTRMAPPPEHDPAFFHHAMMPQRISISQQEYSNLKQRTKTAEALGTSVGHDAMIFLSFIFWLGFNIWHSFVYLFSRPLDLGTGEADDGGFPEQNDNEVAQSVDEDSYKGSRDSPSRKDSPFNSPKRFDPFSSPRQFKKQYSDEDSGITPVRASRKNSKSVALKKKPVAQPVALKQKKKPISLKVLNLVEK